MPIPLRVFRVTEWRTVRKAFAGFSLCAQHGSYLFTCVLCVPLVHNVAEGRKIAVVLNGVIHAVIDRYKMNARLAEVHLAVIADLEIISAEPRHILDDYRSDATGIHIADELLKAGAIKVCPGESVIRIELRVKIAMTLRIIAKHLLLIDNAVAIPFFAVIYAQSAIKRGNGIFDRPDFHLNSSLQIHQII